MTVTIPSLCMFCEHFRDLDDDGTAVCEAFPQGIPHDVFYGEIYHLHPISGDHGIEFDPTADSGLTKDGSKVVSKNGLEWDDSET